MDRVQLLIAVVGPTGSGKSTLALHLAKEYDGEILNFDSLQIYRFLQIGTAKLPLYAREGIPHHLIDVLNPNEVFTAGDFARYGREVLGDLAARGKLPVLAGGTGFYLRALLEGLFPGPQRDEGLRARLAARAVRRPGSLHRLLRRFDPDAAGRIHSNDINKVIRALEVCLTARRPLTELFTEGRDRLHGWDVIKLGVDPPRPALYARLEHRTQEMFRQGLIQEVQEILHMGYQAESKAFDAIGYRETLQFLRGELTRDEAVELTLRNTRRYAKRQWTWFRRDPEVLWLKGFGDDPAVCAEASAVLRERLLRDST
jgi:tRNA dimethylallyltransferase